MSSSTKLNELQNLRDIHLPEPIGFWPLAFGWYLVFIIIVIALSVIAVYFYKRYKEDAPRKKAYQILLRIEADYKRDNNASVAASRISELLKRVALSYYPRREVAGLEGVSWLEFLNNSAKRADFKRAEYELLELPFKKNAQGGLEPLFRAAKLWLSERRKRCSS